MNGDLSSALLWSFLTALVVLLALVFCYVYHKDSDKRKDAKRALQKSEEKWRSLTEYSPDHIMLFDRYANIMYVNRPLPDLGSEEMIGKSLYSFTPSEFHEVAALCIESVIETGKPILYYTEYHTKDGEIRHFEVRIGPIFDSGEVVAVISSSTDITERKLMEKQLEEYTEHLEEKVKERTRELKEAQEQLVKSERLAAIGELAAMIGHDLRNPLTGIVGATYYLKRRLESKMDKKAGEMLDLIEKDVEYSNKIINDLLEYSGEVRLELSETTLKQLIRKRSL